MIAESLRRSRFFSGFAYARLSAVADGAYMRLQNLANIPKTC